MGGVGFEVTGNIICQAAVYLTRIIEKLIITHQEPIEGKKVWILLGYPSKYCNFTYKKKLGRFPHSPFGIRDVLPLDGG